MAYLADSIWVNVSTSGTADFTTTTALAGYRTFADASTPNGSTIHYSARSATQFENGEGVYSSGTGIVTRATIFASSSAGAKVNFSGSPTLAVAPLAEDFGDSSLTIGTTTITGGTTTRVLYDLAGVVQESTALTISSNQPNVLSGSSYLYNGVSALKAVTADSNWFFGDAGNLTLSGTNNIGFGPSALAALTTGSNNVAIGNFAADVIQGGGVNIAIGTSALGGNVSGNYNISLGYLAAGATTGSENIALGYLSLQSNTSGARNIAIGISAVNANIDGTDNSGIGSNSLAANLHGAGNVAIGSDAMRNGADPSLSVGIGSSALIESKGTHNVGVGSSALAAQTTGTGNTGVGALTGGAVVTASFNTLVGYNTGTAVTGTGNTVIGYNEARITSGQTNISIGYQSGVATATANDQLVIGNYIYGTGLDGRSTTISAGKIGFGIKAPACAVDVDGEIRAKGYTIAGTLPAAGTAGRRAYVTNSAASPAFMATLTGGGSTIVPVFDDGTNWRYG